MLRAYAARQALLAALAANAIRPLGGRYGYAASFGLGWPTSELAPHLLALSLADTATEVGWRRPRGRGSRVGLALGVVSAGALAVLVASARRSPLVVEEALRAGLGPEYVEFLDPLVRDAPDPLLRREVVRPFSLRDRENVQVHRNVSYTEGGRRARLDIFVPRRGPQDVPLVDAPVLVHVHGGAWTIGAKEEQGQILLHRMARRGWVGVSVNYRLAPRHRWPTQIIDVKRALAWVHEHIADYGGDPSYLAITGGSAGGHLAALAALTPRDPAFQPGFESADTSVAAAVPFYGVYDLAGLTGDRAAIAMRDRFLGPWVFGVDPRDDPDPFVAASPLARITPDAPDFFVLHGTNDTVVPVRQARSFVATLQEHSKATVTYAELPGAQHAFDVFSSIRSQHVARSVERWLLWHRAGWLD